MGVASAQMGNALAMSTTQDSGAKTENARMTVLEKESVIRMLDLSVNVIRDMLQRTAREVYVQMNVQKMVIALIVDVNAILDLLEKIAQLDNVLMSVAEMATAILN
jgi:hypothetical protein